MKIPTNPHPARNARLAAILAAVTLATASPLLAADAVASNATTTMHAGKTEARRKADDLSRAFRSAARTMAPSVVTINTSTASTSAREGRGRGTGTGVVISADGYIVTANHVVADADEIELVLHDRRTARATVVGLDPGTDIAVLRTDESGLVPAAFGSSDDLEIGEWVVALGAPFGLEQTVTAGIVSAKGRSDVGLATFENYIQTDAAINPGNSGGPLANLDGEIIGINSAISSRGGGNDGIGFAVPSSTVRRVVDSIIASGRVARGYLGIGVQPADEQLLAGLGLESTTGVLVNRVERDSPAAKAGLEPGDLITGVAGQAVRTPGELIAAIGQAAPGADIDVQAVRDGRSRTMHATLAERQDDGAPRRAGGLEHGAKPSSVIGRLGFALRAPGDGATVESGLLVERVDPTGPAARAGIEPGDIVRRIGARTVDSLEDARDAIAASTADAPLALLIERDGMSRYIVLAPDHEQPRTPSDTRR